MEEYHKPLLIIINRNYPPYAGITGASAFDLANFLKTNIDIEIKAVCISDNLQNNNFEPNQDNTVIAIKSIYNGKRKFIRFISTAFESIKMIQKAKLLTKGRKKTMILVMTEPPLLSVFATFLLKNKYTWALWTMDIYPEGLHASKILNNKNYIYKRIQSVLKLYPPAFVIALGDAQHQYLKKCYGWTCNFFIIPCGIRSSSVEKHHMPIWANTDKIIFGYCGNVGEAHNEQFILDSILSLNPDEHLFIASLYGSKGEKLLKKINGFQHVKYVQSVAPAELSFIDVHLVSLLDEWLHICVPSKAVSGVCMGSTFLLNGSDEGDTWKYLANAGWRINQEYHNVELNQVISTITKESIINKRVAAEQISHELNERKNAEYKRLLNYLVTNHYFA